MLDALCGNKSVQKVLLFLFVNGKCYGTQMHKTLGMPLTPVQKALLRLENGGVIRSYYEGKTRLYEFSPAYPLLEELESLLRKTYTLLAPHEKKHFHAAVFSHTQHEKERTVLLEVWKRLSLVKQLTLLARVRAQGTSVFKKKGHGDVKASMENDSVCTFYEKGAWEKGESFTNVFRWTYDRARNLLSLEHLRRGIDRPTFLFYLKPSAQGLLLSVDSHFCGSDTYFGKMRLEKTGVHLHIRIIGSEKNEDLDYHYA